MSEEKPGLHIDTDWKKQAQEEKKKLAEAEAAAKPREPLSTAVAPPEPGDPTAPPGRPGRPRGQAPQANFATLIQTLATQALYYLGDLAQRGAEPMVNLDMAKHQIDTLGMLEEKTKNNLTEYEQKMLDLALYEVRMRYVNVASQFA